MTLWYRAPELLIADHKLQKVLGERCKQNAANIAVFKALERREKGAAGGGEDGADSEEASGAEKKAQPPVYSTGVDTWSIGCIFAELLRGEPLCPASSELQLLQRLFQLLGAPSPEIWPDLPDLWPGYDRKTAAELARAPAEGASPAGSTGGGDGQRLAEQFRQLTPVGLALLEGFLCYDPVKRISCSQALQHEYFSEAPRPQAEAMMPTFPSAHEQQQAVRSSHHS